MANGHDEGHALHAVVAEQDGTSADAVKEYVKALSRAKCDHREVR